MAKNAFSLALHLPHYSAAFKMQWCNLRIGSSQRNIVHRPSTTSSGFDFASYWRSKCLDSACFEFLESLGVFTDSVLWNPSSDRGRVRCYQPLCRHYEGTMVLQPVSLGFCNTLIHLGKLLFPDTIASRLICIIAQTGLLHNIITLDNVRAAEKRDRQDRIRMHMMFYM